MSWTHAESASIANPDDLGSFAGAATSGRGVLLHVPLLKRSSHSELSVSNADPTPHLESLPAVLPEAVLGGVCDNLIVQRCATKPLTVGMQLHSRNRVHARICNVLDLHRDAILPDANGFVVAGGHEPPALIHKGDCVDS